MNEKAVEFLRPYPLSRLVILVHPYSEGYDETYERVADQACNRAVTLYPPINTSEFLFLMPHKDDLGESSKAMDLFRRLRNASYIKENVQIIPDIVRTDKNYKALDEELAKYHRIINYQTEIIIGDERIDDCVESFMRKWLLFIATQAIPLPLLRGNLIY